MSSVSALGSMSMRRCTRYVVVARAAASSSRAVPGFTKCVTSAMCTPTWPGGGGVRGRWVRVRVQRGVACAMCTPTWRRGGGTIFVSAARAQGGARRSGGGASCTTPASCACRPPPSARAARAPLASRLPLGSSRTCSASSMSLHPGGSTLHTGRWRRSSLPGGGGAGGAWGGACVQGGAHGRGGGSRRLASGTAGAGARRAPRPAPARAAAGAGARRRARSLSPQAPRARGRRAPPPPRPPAPVGVCEVGRRHRPRLRGDARVDGGREGRRVDVVLYQQHLLRGGCFRGRRRGVGAGRRGGG